MSEANLWKYVRDGLKSVEGMDLTRHEDSINRGVADVSYSARGVNGWLELKFLPKYPSRGKLKIQHYTLDQFYWLGSHELNGGHTYLLVQIANDYYLFLPTKTQFFLPKMPSDALKKKEIKPWLFSQSCAFWLGEINFKKLFDTLTAKC